MSLEDVAQETQERLDRAYGPVTVTVSRDVAADTLALVNRELAKVHFSKTLTEKEKDMLWGGWKQMKDALEEGLS